MSGRSARQELAFQAYVELGTERSLKRLRELLGESPARFGLARAPGLRTLEDWSVRFGWSERLAEIERQARISADQHRVEHVRERSERLRQAGLLLQSKGLAWFNEQPAERVRVGEAIRAIAEGVRLEAQGLGNLSPEPTTVADYTPFLRRLSDDDLARLEQLLRGAAAAAAAGTGEA